MRRLQVTCTVDAVPATPLAQLDRGPAADESSVIIVRPGGGSELSVVGPRPHALQAKADNILYYEAVEGYFARHKVKPGITGWAQINGWRGETDTLEKMEKRVECDHQYIRDWSPWLDLCILARTFGVVVRGDGAY